MVFASESCADKAKPDLAVGGDGGKELVGAEYG
jgi:hypothetical protein